MVQALSKVIYEPEAKATDCFVIFVNVEEYKKWKAGDTSIPLVEVVDAFDIFFSNQGPTGKLGKASKQQLENVFGTAKDIDAAEKLLKLGSVQSGAPLNSNNYNSTNSSNGHGVGAQGR
ncbi:Ribosome maturation protein SBDS, N-terminal [Phaffia rhodozyma]|uniref:Ribosome maturation protein SBDS, N-terminal n=1 Tax=Phaffia rhodozyma TaxID=264483 RepID=A0A0F7SKA2_PHARH|nr:Ribosome maturation protein SBDS, N-terminal [Phaffia rhodozyma]